MIEEESVWIHSQLTGDGVLSFFNNEHVNKDIDQKDIASVLTMLHVNKFEVSKCRQALCMFLLCLFFLHNFYYLPDSLHCYV